MLTFGELDAYACDGALSCFRDVAITSGASAIGTPTGATYGRAGVLHKSTTGPVRRVELRLTAKLKDVGGGGEAREGGHWPGVGSSDYTCYY